MKEIIYTKKPRALETVVYGKTFSTFSEACSEHGVPINSIRTIARNNKIDYGKAIEKYLEDHKNLIGPQVNSTYTVRGSEGAVFSSVRKELGLKQYELADLLHVSASTLSQWERGYNKPSKDMARELSKLSGRSFEDFL